MRSLDELATQLEAAGVESRIVEDDIYEAETGAPCTYTYLRVDFDPDEWVAVDEYGVWFPKTLPLWDSLWRALSIIRRWQVQAAPDAAMVERGAKAIYRAMNRANDEQVADGWRDPQRVEHYRSLAHAVLAAAFGTEVGDEQ